MSYDVVIVGAGPAGLSAAIYCARKNLSTLILSKNVGGQTAWSSHIENYLGYVGISGFDLTQKFREHVNQYKVPLQEGESQTVVSIEKTVAGFSTRTKNGKTYASRAVIVASGKLPRKLNVPGEDRFFGKGITYCATCDAPLFPNKDVVVIGGGNSAMDAVFQLDKIAKSIYVLNVLPSLQCDPIYKEKLAKLSKVTVLGEAQITGFEGEVLLKKITFEHNGVAKSLDVQGAFIEIGSLPSTDFASLVKKNKWNEIIVNNTAETSLPGVFSAGDVTDVPEKQTIVAAGEGAKAGVRVFEYLSKQKD
ncbi:FAD-dependent oxidoreductase [Candidatus Micrarchaeota archaeon]|nr:FAD-dependent oxidoreductase [Candidatus Micrarchaeota archaeon]